MATTWSNKLSTRFSDLPLVIVGPILKRVENNSVSVFLVLKESKSVTLIIYTRSGISKFSGTRSTTSLGTNLHVVVITANTPNAANYLNINEVYKYDVTFSGGGIIGTFGSNDVLKKVANGLYKITHAPDNLPTFSLPPSNKSHLRIIHASCRKPHGEEGDALSGLNDAIAESITADNIYTARPRPHQLFLTGDQIYADDVADSLKKNYTSCEIVEAIDYNSSKTSFVKMAKEHISMCSLTIFLCFHYSMIISQPAINPSYINFDELGNHIYHIEEGYSANQSKKFHGTVFKLKKYYGLFVAIRLVLASDSILNYDAVEITRTNCMDTSNYYLINTIKIDELEQYLVQVESIEQTDKLVIRTLNRDEKKLIEYIEYVNAYDESGKLIYFDSRIASEFYIIDDKESVEIIELIISIPDIPRNNSKNNQVNWIKIVTERDSIHFRNTSNTWVSKDVENLNQDMKKWLAHDLENNVLYPINGIPVPNEIGRIEFGNDSISKSFHLISERTYPTEIIVYDNFPFFYSSPEFSVLRNYWNTELDFWTDLKVLEDIDNIKKITFKSKVHKNYTVVSRVSIDNFRELEYKSRIDINRPHRGNKIGSMVIKHDTGKNKIVFYEKLVDTEEGSIVRRNLDIDIFYAYSNGKYYECYYYDYNDILFRQ